MGLPVKDSKKKQVAALIANRSNQTSKEIMDALVGFKENSERFKNVTKDILVLSKNILNKLSSTEAKELTAINKAILELNKEHINSYKKILDLSKKQNKRTENAIKMYKNIAEE